MDSGEPLPAEELRRHQHVQRLFWAAAQRHAVAMALLDQDLHGETAFAPDTLAAASAAAQDAAGVPPHARAGSLHVRFGHLATYGAGYYTYPWCKALAGLVWQQLFARDAFSAAAGARLRGEVLVHGAGRDPWRMLERTLGAKPAVPDLVRGCVAARPARAF